MPLKRISMMPKIVEQGCIFVCLLSCSIAARKSLPYQPGSHTVIRKHRTDQAETVTPSEAKSSHRPAEYCKIKADIGKILRQLCQQKGVEIIAAEACPDHIHMLLSIPPKYSVSQIMGYLKGKSSLMIFDRHANLKYKYGNRHFWARGYYVDTVGRNKKQIKEYIQNQRNRLIITR